MDRQVLVSLEALNETVRYLAEKPYKEVVDLIDALKNSIREAPSDKTQEEENKGPNSQPPAETTAVSEGPRHP
jgi:non-homologous end joining protein Ku